MSLLVQALQKINEENDINIWNNLNNWAFPTGFTAIDVLTGNLEKDAYGFYSILNAGFSIRAHSIVGQSSTGKSTLAIQLCASMIDYIDKYYGEKSELVIFDIERYFNTERIKALTGWNNYQLQNKMLLYQDDKTDVVSIYNEIRRICDIKEKRQKELEITAPFVNLDGTKRTQYAPTFIILDSIAMLTSVNLTEDFTHTKSGELVEHDQISKNTEAMTDAKNNTNFIKKIKPLCNKYGIVFIMVNHITDEIKISMFDMPTKQLPFLKQGSRLVGGRELIFQSSSLLSTLIGPKLDQKNPTYSDSIYGAINEIIFYKNKNGLEGIKYPMIMDAALGYMPELSDFELLTQEKYGLNGLGTYTLQILPELGSTTKKQVYEKCITDSLWARAIQFTAKLYLIYKLIYKIDPPDINSWINKLTFEERVGIILTYTRSYPRYNDRDYKMEMKYNYIWEKIKTLNLDKNIQGFFGIIQEMALKFKEQGYIYNHKHIVTLKDLKKENIKISKDGFKYIKPGIKE